MISHDHRLIFVHIPKCAGRSICNLFSQRFDHYTAAYYETEYAPYWKSYHRMTIVRHPLDRLVSLYIYIKNHRRHRHERIATGIDDFKQWLLANINAYKGDFGNSPEGLRGQDGEIGSSFWFSSQWSRMKGSYDMCHIDKIFRLEEGTKPIEDFLSDITKVRIAMPHENRSEYDNWRTFYDSEAYAIATTFGPVIEDCQKLKYSI